MESLMASAEATATCICEVLGHPQVAYFSRLDNSLLIGCDWCS